MANLIEAELLPFFRADCIQQLSISLEGAVLGPSEPQEWDKKPRGGTTGVGLARLVGGEPPPVVHRPVGGYGEASHQLEAAVIKPGEIKHSKVGPVTPRQFAQHNLEAASLNSLDSLGLSLVEDTPIDLSTILNHPSYSGNVYIRELLRRGSSLTELDQGPDSGVGTLLYIRHKWPPGELLIKDQSE